jgi:hypothetical protein
VVKQGAFPPVVTVTRTVEPENPPAKLEVAEALRVDYATTSVSRPQSCVLSLMTWDLTTMSCMPTAPGVQIAAPSLPCKRPGKACQASRKIDTRQ